MANLNTHTVSLIDNLRNLNANLLKLIKMFQTIRDILVNTEKLLMISKQLSDRIDELYNLLVAVNTALLALSNVPYIGPVAKVVQEVVAQIKKIVKKAKDKINDLEKKIKPHREKIKKFREYIDKILNLLIPIQGFIKKEEQLLSASHKMTNSIPNSRYKNLSLERVNDSSKSLHKILIVPNEIVDKVNKLLSAMNSIIVEVDRLCKLIEQVIRPIVIMLNELERIENVTKDLSKALQQGVSVDIGVTTFTLSIEEVLNSSDKSIPGLNVLTKLATKILDPLLKPLGLKVDSVPGLDGGVRNLGQVLEKLNAIDKLKNKITASISDLTGDHKPQKTFEKIDAGV